MKREDKRDRTIDGLRGLAIILVVVGHAVQSTYADFDSNLIFRFIYASHMPLFMFVSGYAAGFSAETRGVGIYKKFLAFVVPFLSWYAVAYFANQSWNNIGLKSYVARVIVSPDWGLWFLPILFFCYLLLALGRKFEDKIGVIIYLIIWLVLQLVPYHGFGLDLLKWHFMFFIVGYLANYKYNLSSLKIPTVATVCFGITYVGATLLWYRTMTAINLRALNFLPIPGHNLTHPLLVSGFKCLVALLGIAFWWAVIKAVGSIKAREYLAYLGLFTLDIYVCHLYFFRLSFGGSLMKLVLSVIFGLLGPLVLSYFVLRRFSLVNKLFLGNRPLADFRKRG